MATVYVTKHASASNLNDGSDATTNALATAEFGFNFITGGDTLKFGTGTHVIGRSTIVSPIPSGTIGNYTVITDNADGVVTFNHSGANVGFIRFDGSSPVKEYIRFVATSSRNIVFDAQDTPAVGAGIYVGGGEPASTCPHFIEFIGIEVKNCYNSGVLSGHSEDLLFDGCYFVDNGADRGHTTPNDHGFYGVGARLIVRNCHAYDNFGWGFHIYSTSAPNYQGRQIYNNRCYNNGYGNGTDNVGGSGILVASGGGIVYNNVCYKNRTAGIDVWRTTNLAVVHNAVHENVGDGISAGRGSGATTGLTIKNNITIGNGGSAIKLLASCQNAVVSWNIADGALSNGGTGTSQSNNTTNAVAAAEWTNPSDATLASRTYGLRQVTQTNASGNWTVTVSSNIVTVNTVSDHGFTAGMRAIFDADWTVNSFLASTSAIIASVPSSTTFTMAIVQGDQGATTETDTAAGIIAQSTAIGGTTFNEVPSVTISQDITGVVRPQGPFVDQGPHEYTAGGGEGGGSTVWAASSQIPSSSWLDSGFTGLSVRVLIKNANITEDASAIRVVLKGRASSAYTVTKVSIVERDGSGLDAVGTITNVTFGSTWAAGVTVPQNGQATSDDISFALDNTKDHFITYYASGSVGAVRSGTGTDSTWFVSGDIAGTADWEGQTIASSWPHIYGVLLIEEADSPEPGTDAPVIGHTSPYTAVAGVYLSVPLVISDGDSDVETVQMVGENMTIRVTPTTNVAVTVP